MLHIPDFYHFLQFFNVDDIELIRYHTLNEQNT